jgi:hypothetical protein
METVGVKLSDDEVRERFSAYHDGELPPDEAAAVRERLDASKALSAEYDAFCKMLSGLSGLGADVPPDAKPGVAPPAEKVDLLAGVQKRLNQRSGGKFYRNRWSRTAGVVPLEALALVVLGLLVLAYVAMTFISDLQPAAPSAPPPPASAPAPR